MNVLLVASSYLPNLGGLQSVTSNLASELQRRGHSITVVTNRHPRALAAQETINAIPVTRWLFLTPHLHYLKNGRLDLFAAACFYFPITLFRLIRFLSKRKTDIVNLHFVGAPAIFLLLARAVVRFPLIVSLHGNDVEGLDRASRYDRWVFRATVRAANAVMACSQHLLDRAVFLAPQIESKARVVYNGVNVTENPVRRKTPTNGAIHLPALFSNGFVVGVGRLERVKGFDILLRALKECREKGVVIPLVLIGNGPERLALEQLAQELGVESQVAFLGVQPHITALSKIKASRFVVVPSRQESFSLVALEAMSCSKAVVGTQCGGIPEVVRDNETGLLARPDDPPALAKAMLALWQDPERRESMGRQGHKLASRKFSTEANAEQYLETYAHVAQLYYAPGQ